MNRKNAAIILICSIAVGILISFRYLNLETFQAYRQALADFHAGHRGLTVLGFMIIYIAQTALSLPGAAVLSVAAGAIFGTVMGTVYANIAATIGATLAFLVTRYLLRDTVLAKFGDQLEGINRELEARGLNYLLFLRLVPIFPFFLINLAAGLTRLPLRTFVVGTLLGIIPGGFVFVNAGASLATITSLSGILSARVLGSFALLGLFALIPALYNKIKSRRSL